jgi:hypothetical protein
MPSLLTRRHVLLSAAATAAVAAMPAAVAIAAVEQAPVEISLAPAWVAWTPGRVLRPRELLRIASRWHVVLFDHVAGDEPSERCLSRPLRIEDGRFVEE